MSSEKIVIHHNASLDGTLVDADPLAWAAVVSPEVEGFLKRNELSYNLVGVPRHDSTDVGTWQLEVKPPLTDALLPAYVLMLQGLTMLQLRSRDIDILDNRHNDMTFVGRIASRQACDITT